MKPHLSLLLCAAILLPALSSRAGDSNIALQRPVTASGTTSGAAALVTDGDGSTSTAPSTAGVIGFYYQIDLGKEYPIQAIDLYSKVNDGANKLSKVRMAVYSDNGGVAGVERWGYEIRADGSNNVQGAMDHLTASLNPAGTMRGRFVRLTNVANTSNAPQIAEIEVFEAPTPVVKYFGPNAGNITKTGAPGLPTEAVLTWNVAGATAISIDQGIGTLAGSTGSVTVSPATTTTYTLTATNGAGLTTSAVTIGVDQVEQPPSISEFLASNVGGIKDSAGKRQDWIEIANPNAFAINMAGHYLTDNPLNKIKWQFPAFTVPGNGYAIVFASNATLPSPPLETPATNFSLTADGEYLALVARDGLTVLTQFPADYPTTLLYPKQAKDHSYGITGATTGFYQTPTPNAANGPTYDGVVADTVFNLKRGFYTTPIDVTITCATAGAEIRYTLDGTTPTATTGTVYSAPIAISTTKVLRAAAFKPNWAPTNVDTQTYIFTANVKATASSAPAVPFKWQAPATFTSLTDADADLALREIPSMNLTTGPGVTIDGGTDKLGTLELIDPAGGDGFQIPCGAQLFGGAFTIFDKKSFRISFKGEYGASKLKYPLFAGFERGLAAVDEFDQLELRNGSHDMNARGFYMSNAFTDATMLDMGSFAPHSRFIHLYLNGTYWGVYQLRERWAADMMAAYYGGQSTDYESINGNLNVGGWADPGMPYDGTAVQWENMKTLARSGSNTYEKLRPYLDVPQYVDYMIMWMFGKSEDEYRTTGPVGFGHGYKFMLNDADGYLVYAPYGGPAINRTTRTAPGKAAGDGPGSFFSMLYKDGGPDYRALLADRIQRSYVTPGGAMTPARNAARLSELCATIQKSMTVECARWNYQTPTGWAGYRDAAIASFTNRTTDVLATYATAGFYPVTAPPVLSLAPGTVAQGAPLTMTTTTAGGLIYFTTDGSDPRLTATSPLNAPLVTLNSAGRYHVPSGQSDGTTLSDIPGLVSRFAFDGSSVDTLGGSGGTLIHGASVVSPGRTGTGAALFDGVNDAFVLGNPTALQFTGPFTLSAWVRTNSINGTRDVISRGMDTPSTPGGEIFLRIQNGAWQGGFTNGATQVIAAGPATGAGSAFADIGIWTHMALVYDGSNWKLFRNGAQLGGSQNGAAPSPPVGWCIGARGDGLLRYFGGRIDDVRFFIRALDVSEITSLSSGAANSPSIQWIQPAFDDSNWTAGYGAAGFAPAASPLQAAFTESVEAAMQNVSTSLYLRQPFTLSAAEKAATTKLQLVLKSADGCAVYLNGTRLLTRNAPATLDGSSLATVEVDDSAALAGETIDLTSFLPLLRTGTNLLAIQGLSSSVEDTDFLLSAELQSQRGPAGLAAAATTYSAPLALDRSTVIHARTRNPATGEWSGLQEIFYQVGPTPTPAGALVVSELHYNPSGDDDGEFIELMNVSDAAINLRGVSFAHGVTFAFPNNRDIPLGPGQRLVLVDSELTFQKIHGWSAPLGGIYSDALDNGGEQVTLVAADGVTVLVDFIYDGAPPWPDAAVGGGRSLVLISPAPGVNMNDAASWRVSRGFHGNPNANDEIISGGGFGPTAVVNWSSLNAGSPFRTSSLTGGGPAITISLDHRNGADTDAPRAQASSNLQLWDVPVRLIDRQLLPGGVMLRSTWQAIPDGPAPDRLFFRALVP